MKVYPINEIKRIYKELEKDFIEEGEFLRVIQDMRNEFLQEIEYMRNSYLELINEILVRQRMFEERIEELERRLSGAIVSRALDMKTGKYVNVLKVPTDTRFLDETEGILFELDEKLKEEGIDTPDLVKKAWKTNE